MAGEWQFIACTIPAIKVPKYSGEEQSSLSSRSDKVAEVLLP